LFFNYMYTPPLKIMWQPHDDWVWLVDCVDGVAGFW
jgi:hypothetical protein